MNKKHEIITLENDCNFIENDGPCFNESVKQKNINILKSHNVFKKGKRILEIQQ